ncbi:GTP-binding protein [Chroococcus sp. FPU101]|uniref:GTP-binding protein n=1 Tax=Chroococcus sp. FPU101 TaxID=1974212 RepID=UPI001A8F6B5D|nr:GTP-binding protein [Chroococcus sp. FPU101]GFE68506.1 hypothetical protein CFPU101_11160 [Chroococcus sp. FPU101]
MITAVTGPPGTGKTYWIQEQMAKAKENIGYYSPRTESIPIDIIYLQSEYPHLKILTTENLKLISEKTNIYLELPWYLDLLSIEPFLKQLNCHRVAILPPNISNTGWHSWADEVIPSIGLEHQELTLEAKTPLEVHRGILTGEVLDYTSLITFWSELTQNAYGEIKRIKGIFDIFDGQSIYGDFVQGFTQEEFSTLDLPRHLEGRPTRFSGFEIVGRDLDKTGIAQSINDCCLSDSAINYYQQQVKATLELEVEMSR